MSEDQPSCLLCGDYGKVSFRIDEDTQVWETCRCMETITKKGEEE